MAQADNRAYDYCECETSGDNHKRFYKYEEYTLSSEPTYE